MAASPPYVDELRPVVPGVPAHHILQLTTSPAYMLQYGMTKKHYSIRAAAIQYIFNSTNGRTN